MSGLSNFNKESCALDEIGEQLVRQRKIWRKLLGVSQRKLSIQNHLK
jgi:hypothetical protein